MITKAQQKNLVMFRHIMFDIMSYAWSVTPFIAKALPFPTEALVNKFTGRNFANQKTCHDVSKNPDC